MTNWVSPQYTKGQFNRAAKSLVKENLTSIDRLPLLDIINNWRSSHSYPLHISKITLQRREKNIDTNSISAQRLKRLSSITSKLQRNPHMVLTQMQDIGGCRAVMSSIKKVNELIHIYQEANKKSPVTRPNVIEIYDYINHPKEDGYRSYHLVYKYSSDSPSTQAFVGLRTEIQIRSKLQHAWATAVETVSTFTENALKSGMGDEKWKRFFALMGSAFALRENTPLVPNTPTDEQILKAEIKNLFYELKVELMLSGLSAVVRAVTEIKDAQAYLLVLDSTERKLTVTSYTNKEMDVASQKYLEIEEMYTDNPSMQAVLVSVDSMANLQSAYPNYYLDTKDFLEAVKLVISN